MSTIERPDLYKPRPPSAFALKYGDGNGHAPNQVEEALDLGDEGPPDFRHFDNLPTIVARGRQLPDVTTEVVNALADANDPPAVFVRGGSPVRVKVGDDGNHVIAVMNETAVRGRIARVGRFVMLGKNDHEIEISPPVDVVRDVMALDLHQVEVAGVRPFPILEGVTTIPVIRPDWSIIERPGYDAGTRLYYAPSADLKMPAVPERPTKKDVAEAVGLLDETIGEFPYESVADRANAFATLITPAVRQAVGKSPLALLDAPQAGTGKSLLADAVGHILNGSPPAMMGAPADDTEWRKQITSTLLEGPTVIVIDNIDAPLTSASLARALTSGVWSDRILGASVQANLTNRATWIGTGNNIELGGDMPRRCYRIRLDAKSAQPWRGREFTHPNLLEWISANRGRLVRAILILCRAWNLAGKPVPDRTPVIGSFEGWSKTIGGILYFAGVPGFLSNLDDMYEQADDGGREWETFLRTWQARYGGSEIPVSQLVDDLQSEGGNDLRDTLPEGLGAFVVFQPPRYMEAGRFVIKEAGRFKIRLGKQLRQRVGRRYGDEGLHLSRREDSHDKVAVWSVEVAGSAGSAGGVFTQDD